MRRWSVLWTAAVVLAASLLCDGLGATSHPSRVLRLSSRAAMSMSSSEPVADGKFFYSSKSFASIGLSEAMEAAPRVLSLQRPSKIQALSFGEVLSGRTCIVADQTGSGKTLAYLLPTVQRFLEWVRTSETPARSPYVVIITPTTELANQVSRVVKSLANAVKFRTACITSVSDMDSEQKKLRLGAEVLVSTPGRLLALIKRKEVFLDRLQTIVLDEADVLFMDQSFPLPEIGQACPASTQFIFTTATLPDSVERQITSEFPSVLKLSGPGLHRIAPNIEETLIDCSGPPEQERNPETAFENKRLALLKALEQNSDAERTLVFCNSIEQCRRVENALKRVDRLERLRLVLAYHGAIDAKSREEHVVEFSRRLLKKPAVLICTDRASRGMDFDRAQVDHVILFDFPAEPSEYVRRIGRTGRAGRAGKATILVHGRQVPIAKQVVTASIEGKRIDPIPELSGLQTWGGVE